MMTAFDRDVWAIMGMPLDNVTLEEAARLVERAVETRQRLSFVTPNVNWMVRALKDEQAMRQIVNADLSLADGAPVVWLARQLGMPLKERVAGSDLFDLLRKADPSLSSPIRVFFFGGREGSAQAAHDKLLEEQGRLVSVGWHNPGFGDVDSMTREDICAKIKAGLEGLSLRLRRLARRLKRGELRLASCPASARSSARCTCSGGARRARDCASRCSC